MFESLLDYRLLIPAAIMLGLAPFFPEPHLVEKLRMLFHGDLTKPVDIFDLFFHSWPLGLIGYKLYKTYA